MFFAVKNRPFAHQPEKYVLKDILRRLPAAGAGVGQLVDQLGVFVHQFLRMGGKLLSVSIHSDLPPFPSG